MFEWFFNPDGLEHQILRVSLYALVLVYGILTTNVLLGIVVVLIAEFFRELRLNRQERTLLKDELEDRRRPGRPSDGD